MSTEKSIWDYTTSELCVEDGEGMTFLNAASYHSRDLLLDTVQWHADRLGATLYIRAVGENDDFCLPVEPTEEE